MMKDEENLSRSISRFGFAALSINGLIGSGIFVLPALAAKTAGEFSPWMFFICGLLMSTVVLTFSKLSSYFSGTGGPIVYAQEAFGDAVSFQTGWLLYFGRVSALAANANALLFYLSLISSHFLDPVVHKVTVAVVILSVAGFNLLGVKKAIQTVNVLTYLKIVPLILFIGVGIFYIQPEKLFSTNGLHTESFSTSMLLLVYAYIGFESAVVPAGEARNPRKDIPQALMMTLTFTTMLYFLIQMVSINLLPQLSQSNSPLADAAGIMAGPVGVLLITSTAVISIFGNLSSVMVAAPRMTYSLAINGNLPKWFGRISTNTRIPHLSIYFTTAMALILALTGSFVFLAVVSSLARMIGYGICIGALPTIRKTQIKDDDQFRLAGGYLIPVIAFIVTIWLSLQANLQSWGYTLAFILLGFVFFALERFKLKTKN